MHTVSVPIIQRPPGAIALGPRAWVVERDLSFTFSRSGGPGGQNVNKVESRVQLRVALSAIKGLHDAGRARLADMAHAHLIGGLGDPDAALQFTASEERSQRANKEACMERFHALVLLASTPPKVRRTTRPTRGSRERRLEGKRIQGEKKSRRQDP